MMMIAREVAHVTISADTNPNEEDDENSKRFSRLLTEGYQIVCQTPVRTDSWCGVQYLLVKETEPGRARERRK